MAAVQRAILLVEAERVSVKCGNLEILPRSEGRPFGTIKLDGIEQPHVTSVRLTWDVDTDRLWHCEIGHIVDERVTGKRRLKPGIDSVDGLMSERDQRKAEARELL